MNAQQVVDYVWQIAPNPPFGTENIFELGGPEIDVQGIGVAWWITSDMLEDFARKGINLGLTHERVIYDVPEQKKYNWGIVPKTFDVAANARIRDLSRRHGITIHRFHSNIDVADWGMPRALFDLLGWSEYPIDWSRGVPVVEHPPMSLRELIDQMKSKLRLPFVRYDGDLNRTIRRSAVPWGGLCQWWTGACCAAPLGFDALIGGDVIDGVVRLAREQGWAVLDIMHHATEMPAMERLAEKLRQHFPKTPVHYYENTMPWAVR